MSINQSEKTKLYDALAIFQNVFRSYLIKCLKAEYGENWLDKFKQIISFQQLDNLERNLQNNPHPERSIDFQHFKSFALKNKELLKNDFGNKAHDLPTWLGEITEVRNKIAHFDEIEEDEAIKTWINLRTIGKFLRNQELQDITSTLRPKKVIQIKTNDDSEEPNERIKEAVDAQPNLSLKPNKGGHHRIMKKGWNDGSLWIYKTAGRGYRVETTGIVGTYLNTEIKQFLNRDCDHITTKSYKIWFVKTLDEVSNILAIFNRIQN